jgi:hypothetical protein
MSLKATPIIKDKFWIVEDGNIKVGTIYYEDNNKFVLTTNKKITETFENLESIKKKFGDSFFVTTKSTHFTKIEKDVYGYPVDCIPYNLVYDIKRKLPLYTKTPESKSIFCAGYYAIKLDNIWSNVFCPKLISIHRYENHGPFKTEEEAKEVLNGL